MLQTFLNILHVTVCLFLILVVLLQQGRGGGMGSAFGGTNMTSSWNQAGSPFSATTSNAPRHVWK